MDLSNYRQSESERQRTEDLMRHVRSGGVSNPRALDIGARDGHFSMLLAECFDEVTALDLEKPEIAHPRVTCVKGDITGLDFADETFDLVFCAEVLEHIPAELLTRATAELTRVARKRILIGVPFRQDIRIGRTTCQACGAKNPPWGHVNSFDQPDLVRLFPDCAVSEVSFVGESSARTNALSTLLMDLAGNPYGTYDQGEECVHCGAKLERPPERTLLQKMFTKASFVLQSMQQPFNPTHGNWIHVLFEKHGG